MKTDCLMELERLHNEVEGKILFADTLLYNLANGAAGENVELNGDKPISESEFNYWQPLREYSWGLLESDLPGRLAYELKSNLMGATDKRQVYVTYRAEIEKWIRIDSDRAYRDYTERLTDFDLPEATKKRYLSIMGELVCWYDEAITKPITLCLGEIERDYLGEPQPQPGNNTQHLPTINNTDRERQVFQRAIDAGLMQQVGKGYQWGKQRGMKAKLAYFVECLYCPNGTESLPQTEIERLFSVSRIDNAIYQLHNAKGYLEWRWKPVIDALFE